MAKEKTTSTEISTSKVNTTLNNLKDFLHQCRRVLMISRKPTRQEYITISKVTGLGICLLGFVGFIIHVPITYVKGLIKP
ncbi:protein translocase SEC61 complex, gamma subunit [Methanococcus maripaludis C5]|uniref:Protein translocase subunit SecE n=1 Tax=Methanococcus maripaludis (strain C5 / ATCC BAA-1333) TaxID=402880 RepID=A4FW89_METM5|nr:protein translocase SEC61 complex subunit gamma [Methanococcus maripaludis]ABO34460.1 protein translocase SEC61 complex, gamma subunit [Methanococcus maripaludis C5]